MSESRLKPVNLFKELLIKQQEYALRRRQLSEMKESKAVMARDDIIAVEKTYDDKIIFLARGDNKSGYKHIIDRHGKEFAALGIPPQAIPRKLLSAVKGNDIQGYQGKGQGRPLYRLGNSRLCFCVTISSTGYIVGANPQVLSEDPLKPAFPFSRTDIHNLR